jgi:hypothetical protein
MGEASERTWIRDLRDHNLNLSSALSQLREPKGPRPAVPPNRRRPLMTAHARARPLRHGPSTDRGLPSLHSSHSILLAAGDDQGRQESEAVAGPGTTTLLTVSELQMQAVRGDRCSHAASKVCGPAHHCADQRFRVSSETVRGRREARCSGEALLLAG